jgi:hypothetical protein
VLPENANDSYTEYDTVDLDFQLTYEKRNLVNSSISIGGDLDIYSGGTTKLVVTDRIYIDSQVGAHTLFSGITSELQSKSVIENIMGYPRYVRMQSEASKSPEDVFNSENTCE